MDCNIAFFDLKACSSPDAKPLMLHELLFCPVLTWACEELSVRGIQRFFVICDEKWQSEVESALVGVDGVQIFTSAEAALAAAEGRVMVLPSPVVPVDAFSATSVYTAEADVLRAHLAAGNALAVRPAGGADGVSFLPFRSAAELQRLMTQLQSTYETDVSNLEAQRAESDTLINDLLSDTVAVDMESQMIFDTEDDLIEYTKRLHAEKAAKEVY